MAIEKKYEAIIFDCDGVLVDSEVLSASAWVEILASHNVEVDLKTILHDFQGGNIHLSLEYITNLTGTIDKIGLEKLYRIKVRNLFQKSLKAIIGIHSFLEKSNLKRCIASNGPIAKIIENLEITNLTPFFENNLIFSGQELDMYKPAPDLFLYSASQMKMELRKCVVIEDSKNGVLAAQQAGIDVIYYNAHNTTIDALPTLEFSSMSEIYHFIHE